MAENSAGQIGIDLKINGKNYKNQIKQYGDYGSNQLESTFGKTFKKIGVMAGAAFGIGALKKFGASCISLGSDLAEVQNVVDVSFPNMTSQVSAFAKSAISNFGMSELAAKKFMGSFGAMSRAYGFNEKQAAEMSETLTGLVGDVSSFYNIDQEDAYAKLSAVFTSETEALKHLGVVMTQNALDEYALANGYGKTTAKMTEQEKVALRYAFIQKQLSLATGDFIRTQDSWANQTRVLSLRFDQIKASLGKGFIALFTPIVKGINWVLANLQPLADSFGSLMEMLTGYSGDSGAGIAKTAGDLSSASSAADDLGSGLSDSGKKGEAAAKKIQKAFAGVDTINKLSFSSDDGDSGKESGGSGAGGSVADAVEFPKAEKQGNAFKGVLDGLFNEFKRLSEIFKNGFKIGFGDSFKDIDRIKDSLTIIKESLVNIFSDGSVQNHAKNMVNNIVEALGKMVGSAASIGTTFITLITGSIANYLQGNVGFLKQKMINIFDIASLNAYMLGEFSTVIADIATVFSSNKAIQIGSNLIQAVINGALNAIELLGIIGSKILNAIISPIMNNKDAIKTAISEALTPIEQITSFIASKMTDWDSFVAIVGGLATAFAGFKSASILSSTLTTVTPLLSGLGTGFSTVSAYASTFFGGLSEGAGIFTTIQTMLPSSISSLGGLGSTLLGLINPVTLTIAAFASLIAGFVYLYTSSTSFRDQMNSIFSAIASQVGGVISGLVDIIKTIWTEGVGPIVTNTITAFQNLWDNGLSVFVENVSIFVGRLVELVLSIWNNAINPFINLLLTTFLPIFTSIWNGILEVAVPIIENIMEYVNMFMDVVNVLIDLLSTHVFPIFKDVFEGVGDIIKAFMDFAQPIFDGFMKLLGELIDFAMKNFMAPMKTVFGTVVETIKNIVDPIKKTIEGVRKVLKGIIDFVVGIFTGDWGKAWDGIKGIFEGMWESLSGIVDAVWKTITGLFSNAGKIFSGIVKGIGKVFTNIINCIIDGINKVIAFPFDSINNILNGIRNFKIPMIGRPFSGLWDENPLPVPQIPKLAQGGYVGANQPQLAMIGDNRHYGEIVTPENKMYDIVMQALSNQKTQGDIEGITMIIELLKNLISLIKGLSLSVNIDKKKLAILLRQAEKELEMIGG